MTWQTSLKYKAGLLLETGLLLSILGVGRALHGQVKGNKDLTKFVDFGVWALIIFGSDGIVGLLRKLQVKLGLAQPRVTLEQSQETWYKHIAKPSWTPPGWVFPVVWIPCKLLQVFASRIVWIACKRNPLAAPVALFALHQGLADLWNTAFFREHYIKGGMSIIFQFFAALLATTAAYNKTDPLAGVLLIPTCLWMVIASALNVSIYRKNY